MSRAMTRPPSSCSRWCEVSCMCIASPGPKVGSEESPLRSGVRGLGQLVCLTRGPAQHVVPPPCAAG
eukprot:4166252-Heterocapsa_arctica.AAC.1